MENSLISPSFLFRFSFPCKHVEKAWPVGESLTEEHRLAELGGLDGGPSYADVRAGWNEHGLTFYVKVDGKRQPPWCRDNRLDDSDGLHVWIDTRDTHNIHRAGRFCHHFVFLPTGGGSRLDQPVADQMLINRARENANPVRPNMLKVRAVKRADGYVLDAFVPAAALTGFDPREYPRLGFMYAVLDRERGEQTLAYGQAFPYQEDPSVWCTLELSR
ncbi:MAG: hypothetical protein SGJ20_15305 [Planctomycetota bacterium]|nr:hypothetical protein [Planctomycetota bacterium]